MTKTLYTLLMLLLCTASFAQEADPGDLAEMDKPAAPKVVEKAPPSIFTNVDQMPEYPGGSVALINYLSRNIQYPDEAKKNNIQGRVVVKFVVCENGTLCNEEVIRSIGGGCDEEVIRVVKAMPKWKPGKQNGKAVKVYYTLPVSFKFNEEDKPVKTEK